MVMGKKQKKRVVECVSLERLLRRNDPLGLREELDEAVRLHEL